jgi:hypothetical protein
MFTVKYIHSKLFELVKYIHRYIVNHIPNKWDREMLSQDKQHSPSGEARSINKLGEDQIKDHWEIHSRVVVGKHKLK